MSVIYDIENTTANLIKNAFIIAKAIIRHFEDSSGLFEVKIN